MTNTFSVAARIGCRLLNGMLIGSLMATLLLSGNSAVSGYTGEQIYQRQCASCHGVRGEGDKEKYPHALTGDRSLAQLARFISRRMPKDDPGTCVGQDAQKVSQYIYEAFYSPTAQARNKRARIELARLTVRQYRNAVADLIGSFRPRKQDAADDFGNPKRRDPPRRGLRGDYYKLEIKEAVKGGKKEKFDPVFTRVDPEIRFDFEQSRPDPTNEKLNDNQFSIRWRGSVLAPDTGEYEFIIRTEKEHGVRLWVNDLNRPLINGWVKTGDDKTEYRGTVFLLGGRFYPLQMDFSKLLTLSDANEVPTPNAKAASVRASITLQWKPPQRAAEVIPQQNLTPEQYPETFAAAAPFPPDDRSVGYERGASVSEAWDEAVTAAAVEAMTHLIAHLRELTGVAVDAADARTRLRDFCLRLAERAFRQPLTAEQKQLYVDRQFEAERDLETAVKRVVVLVLKSPRFLYREVDCQDAYAAASQLSFGLWDSLPDANLLQAAAAGRLAARVQVARQAERMVMDRRTRAKLREFFLQQS